MELSRNAKIALYGLPIAVGLYLIYRQLSKSKAAKAEPSKPTPPQPQTPTKPTQPTANDAFPLKKGSRDAGAPYAPSGRVVALQSMINIKGYDEKGKTTRLKEDGIFGPKTEEAVIFWLNKNSVDNLDDWNEIFRGVAPYIAAPIEESPMFNSYDRIVSF
jgi:peptidoglycan hydrolase-like protein with peptidoglycan-binding domain